jgi:hypothetical protein
MSPKAKELKNRITREIGISTVNTTGWDFRPHLLPLPKLRQYRHSTSTGKLKLWTILAFKDKENVDHHVVYDEEEDCFGVAIGGMYVGLYGTLTETIDSLP